MNVFKKKEKSQTEKNFNIDLEKGLYVGAGVLLKDKNGNVGEEVEPVYIEWGNLAGHLAVFGTTRVGKTRLMVAMIKQCIFAGFDILVVEPKGAEGQETIAWVLQFAEEAGRLRDFTYISPLYSELSISFNPLYGLSNEEISSLVETLIPAKDDFYSKIGYTITMAVLLGLDFLEKIEGPGKLKALIKEEYEQANMGSIEIIDVKNKIANPDLAKRIAEPEVNKALSETHPPYRTLVTFADLATYSTQEGLNAILQHVESITDEDMQSNEEIPLEKMRVIQMQALRALREQATKDASYFGKVASSFNLVMQQLSTGKLGEVLCTTKINTVMDRYRNKNHGQILILQPFPLKYKAASDAFVRIFFAMFTAQYGDVGATGRALKRKIFLFIDEGGSVLYPGVEDLFNKAGGLGLRICLFTQSFADLDNAIGKESAYIVNDNINTKIYMKMNDPNSRKQIQDAFGTIIENLPSYAGSKLDMKITSSGSGNEKNILTSAHVADLQNQEFLMQTKTGFYAMIGPFQPDPPYEIEMPISESEQLYKDHALAFASIIEETKTGGREKQ